MRGHKISDIAAALSAPFAGNGDIVIQCANEPRQCGDQQLAVAMSLKYADDLTAGNARAAILWDGADWRSFGLEAAIFVQRPRLAMAALTQHLKSPARPLAGIHVTAIVDPSALIGDDCSIGPFAVIGAGVKIGACARIDAHVTIGQNASIGDNCTLNAGVRISNDVKIGRNFFAHFGVVIGDDGFSFVTPEKSTVEDIRETLGDAGSGISGQSWQKIQSLGGVSIGDDVEIGANSNVDAGTLRATSIGDGTKIDALVQIAHNVRIGTNCLLCGQVGVAGSATIGKSVVLGGQVGVVDNIKVGDGVIAGAGSMVLSNVPAGRAVLGNPAVKMERHIESYKALRRLPGLLQRIAMDKKSVPKGSGSD